MTLSLTFILFNRLRQGLGDAVCPITFSLFLSLVRPRPWLQFWSPLNLQALTFSLSLCLESTLHRPFQIFFVGEGLQNCMSLHFLRQQQRKYRLGDTIITKHPTSLTHHHRHSFFWIESIYLCLEAPNFPFLFTQRILYVCKSSWSSWIEVNRNVDIYYRSVTTKLTTQILWPKAPWNNSTLIWDDLSQNALSSENALQ